MTTITPGYTKNRTDPRLRLQGVGETDSADRPDATSVPDLEADNEHTNDVRPRHDRSNGDVPGTLSGHRETDELDEELGEDASARSSGRFTVQSREDTDAAVASFAERRTVRRMTAIIMDRHPHLEGLRAELRDYLDDDEQWGLVVWHPLLTIPLYDGRMVRAANDVYEQSTSKVDDARARSRWLQVLLLHQQPYRLGALADFAESGELDKLSVRQWAKLVKVAWMDSDFPGGMSLLRGWTPSTENPDSVPPCDKRPVLGGSPKHWDFRRTRVITAMSLLYGSRPHRLDLDSLSSPEERVALAERAVDGHITINRGVDANAVAETGLSWTLNRELAIWFAEHAGSGSGVVLSAEVSITDVLAYFTDRGEDEILLTETALHEVEETARMEHQPVS